MTRYSMLIAAVVLAMGVVRAATETVVGSRSQSVAVESSRVVGNRSQSVAVESTAVDGNRLPSKIR